MLYVHKGIHIYLMQKTCSRNEKDGTLLDMFHTQSGCCPLFAVVAKENEQPRCPLSHVDDDFSGSKVQKIERLLRFGFFCQFHIWTMALGRLMGLGGT